MPSSLRNLTAALVLFACDSQHVLVGLSVEPGRQVPAAGAETSDVCEDCNDAAIFSQGGGAGLGGTEFPFGPSEAGVGTSGGPPVSPDAAVQSPPDTGQPVDEFRPDAGRDAGVPPPPIECPSECECSMRGQRQFVFCADKATRQGTQEFCYSLGIGMIRIKSADQATFIVDSAIKEPEDTLWLGANDLMAEGVWRWDDGARFWDGEKDRPLLMRYDDWAKGEPKKGTGINCAVLISANDWVSVDCGEQHRIACMTDF